MENIKIKKCVLAYVERNNSVIPVLNFLITRRRFLGTDEVDLCYDGEKFFGDKLGIENDEDLEDEELDFYSHYIMNYKNYITCSEDIHEALDYFYENKLNTLFLKFLSNTGDRYFAIDCTDNDWYGEYFKTKKESLNWLYGIEG